MSEKILITGVTGFLGSYIANTLVEKGYDIIGLKRKGSDLFRIQNIVNKIDLINVDGLNFKNLFLAGPPISTIIHTATNYGRHNESLSQINQTNVNFPIDLLDTASDHGLKVFLNTDTSLNKNLNSYTMTKYQFLNWGKFLSQKKNISFINFKVEHMYGPNDDVSKFSSYLIQSCIAHVKDLPLTKGEQMRDFIHVADVVSAYLTVLKKVKTLGNGFHQYELGSGKAISIKDFSELVKKLTNSKLIYALANWHTVMVK